MAALKASVLDGSGKPVPAASVTVSALVASGARADELTVLTGTLPLAAEAAGLPGATFAPQGKVRTAVSDMPLPKLGSSIPNRPGRIQLKEVSTTTFTCRSTGGEMVIFETLMFAALATSLTRAVTTSASAAVVTTAVRTPSRAAW